MKLHEALEAVAAFYAPGIVQYYGQLKPDPWQQAHDELETVAGTFDPDIVSPAAQKFVSRCKELSDRFKQDGKPSKSTSPADGFAMTPESVAAHHSRKQKRCAYCESRDRLKILPVNEHSMDVQLVCAACRGAA